MARKIKNQSFSLKIFSVIMAIILWIILIITVNPTTTKTIRNLPVTFTGTETLAEKGLVLINSSKINGVDVKIRGPRSSIIKTLDSITATVDVSDITTVGKYNKYTTFDMGVYGISIENRDNSLVTVEVDELISKDIQVEVCHRGAEKGKNIMVESIPEFSELAVRGAKSELEKIEKIVIDVEVSTIMENTEREYEYYFVDENGQKKEAETLQNLPEIIKVTHNIYEKRTVPVTVEIEKDKNRYEMEIMEKSAEEVDIGIPNDFDGKIDEIVYKFNPDNYDKEVETYSLTADVPEGVYMSESSKTIKAKISLSQPRRNTTFTNLDE